MARFRPLHDRVLVKRVEAEEKTPGGIIIPDTAKEKPVEGEVLAVGPGRRDDSGNIQPLDVKVGDRILFAKWSGTEVLIDGLDRLIMKERCPRRDRGSRRASVQADRLGAAQPETLDGGGSISGSRS